MTENTPAVAQPGPSQKQGTAVASSLAVIGAVVTTAANFLIAWLVSLEGPNVAGVFFVSTAVIAIAGNSSCLGTMTGMVYFLPKIMAGDQPNPRALLTLALRPVLAASTTITIGLLAAAPTLASIISDEDDAAAITTMLRILAVVIVPWALTLALLGATRGLGSMTPTVGVNQVLRPALQLLLLGLLFLSDSTPPIWAIATAWGIPVLIASLVAIGSVRALGGFRSAPTAGVTAQEFWSYTRPRAASTALQIALERLDVILVSTLVGTGAAGVYGALTRYITAGNFLIFSVAQAVSSHLRSAISSDAWPAARRLLQQATGWVVLVTWPYFLLVALKRSPLAELLSPDYLDEANILPILAIGMMFSAAAGPIDITLLMLGRSQASLVGVAIALATDIVLLVLLAPPFGLMGAAIAWTVSVIAQNLLASVLVHRTSGLAAWSGAATVSAALSVGAVVPIALLTPETLSGLFISGAGSAAVLGLGAIALHQRLGLDELVPARILNRR